MPIEHHILALIFNGFESLDLLGPLGIILPRNGYYTVTLVNLQNTSPRPNDVVFSWGTNIGTMPYISLDEALKPETRFDTLFISGGRGRASLMDKPELFEQIGELVDRAASVFTVCTGSILLAATGRLEGRKATTNKRRFDEWTPSCMYRASIYGSSHP